MAASAWALDHGSTRCRSGYSRRHGASSWSRWLRIIGRCCCVCEEKSILPASDGSNLKWVVRALHITVPFSVSSAWCITTTGTARLTAPAESTHHTHAPTKACEEAWVLNQGELLFLYEWFYDKQMDHDVAPQPLPAFATAAKTVHGATIYLRA